MKPFRPLIAIVLGAIVLGLSVGIPVAQAYVPPSYFILKSLAAKHAGIKGLRIRTQVKHLEDGKPVEGVTFKSVTAYDPQRGVARTWALGPENQILFLVERTKTDVTAVEQLLLQHDPVALTKAMIAQGIPIKTEEDLLELPDEDQRRSAESTSLKRWQGTIAWVIGIPGGPQLWMEKGSFLPLRFLTSSFEARFEGFHLYRGFPYPKAITAGERGAEPFLREDLIDITVAPVTGDLKGDVAAGSGITEAGKSAPGALRKLLEQYFKHLR